MWVSLGHIPLKDPKAMSCTSHCRTFQKQQDHKKREQTGAGLVWGAAGASQAWVALQNLFSETQGSRRGQRERDCVCETQGRNHGVRAMLL